jgi:hypothetical protein
MPDANPVRGGFDSHTFPPQLVGRGKSMRDDVTGRFRNALAVLACVALLAPAGAALGAEPGDGSGSSFDLLTQATDDSMAQPAAPPVNSGDADTVRVPLRTVRRRTATEKRAPIWWTTVRSGILPGWGQLANGKPVKAALLGGIYAGWAVGAWMAESDRKDAKAALNGGNDPTLTAELNDAVDRRNFRMWMMGATMLYAMLDAYVDAHFRGYDETWSAGFSPVEPAFAVTVRF